MLFHTMTWMNIEGIILSEKPDIKGHILHDSMYLNYPERSIYTDRKQIRGCPGWGKERE